MIPIPPLDGFNTFTDLLPAFWSPIQQPLARYGFIILLPGLNGLHLLLCHAERGAEMLADAGMPADVVWLVRHHEREGVKPALRAVQAADHRH